MNHLDTLHAILACLAIGLPILAKLAGDHKHDRLQAVLTAVLEGVDMVDHGLTRAAIERQADEHGVRAELDAHVERVAGPSA